MKSEEEHSLITFALNSSMKLFRNATGREKGSMVIKGTHGGSSHCNLIGLAISQAAEQVISSSGTLWRSTQKDQEGESYCVSPSASTLKANLRNLT